MIFRVQHLLLSLTLLLQFEAVNAQSKKESSTIQIYTNAKKEFLSFERMHGAFVQTKNVNMHYLSWGNPGNPCIIWAHGSLNNGYELVDIADNLVKAGYHVIAIDYYGHGQTAMPDHEVSIYHIADDIKFLMDKLSIEKAFIGGFSRGGYVATAFYHSYPENVLGLVLEDGGSVAANTYYHKLDTNKLEQISKKFDLKQATPWDKTYPTQLEAFNSLYDSTEVSNQFPIFALIKENKSGDWGIIYSDMMKLFNLENSRQFTDLVLRTSKVPLFARSMVTMEPRIIFRNLRIPVLILDAVSQDDPMPFEKENEALRNVHPHYITYKVYPNTEHNIHYAHPERFTKDLLDSLDGALWWNEAKVVEEAKTKLSTKNYKGKTLYMAMANRLERGIDTLSVQNDTTGNTSLVRANLKFIKELQKANQNQLRYSYKFYEDDNHPSIRLIGEYDALRYIFDFYRLRIYDSEMAE